jgi:hypothetical protein
MQRMQALQRCLACRARLGEAEVCVRCGTDFSISRRAARQATALTRLAVQELVRDQTGQAAAAAAAASQLANSLLAQAVARVIRRREGADLPNLAAPIARPPDSASIHP